jgi:hypothetical protein
MGHRAKRLTVSLPERERRKKGYAHQREREQPKRAKSLKCSAKACIDEEGRRS